MDDAATGGLMYLDGYGVATTDLGRGRMKSHHYLQEVCAIMKPEHGANAVARGPPALIWSGRSGNAAATARDRRCPGHPSAGALRRPNSSSTRPARVLHASCTRPLRAFPLRAFPLRAFPLRAFPLRAFPAGLPCGPSRGDPRVGPFSGLRTGRIHNPQSQTTR